MDKLYSVKYTQKDKWLKLSIAPLSFEDIVNLFGKEQIITIDKLYLFEYAKDTIDESEYNEDFFSGVELSLEMFLWFLYSMDEYKIHSMVFDIAGSDISFSIEDDLVTVHAKQSNEKYLLKVFSQLTSFNTRVDYQKVVKNQGRHVYFKNTPESRLISNSELWNNFAACTN